MRWLLPAGRAGRRRVAGVQRSAPAPAAPTTCRSRSRSRATTSSTAAGQTVRLLGVNHPSLEYACEQGYAYNDGNMDAARRCRRSPRGTRTAVRVPLNEDCWLGINGPSLNPFGVDGGAAYQTQPSQQYVAHSSTQAGLYVIVDLHWNAPGHGHRRRSRGGHYRTPITRSTFWKLGGLGVHLQPCRASSTRSTSPTRPRRSTTRTARSAGTAGSRAAAAFRPTTTRRRERQRRRTSTPPSACRRS